IRADLDRKAEYQEELRQAEAQVAGCISDLQAARGELDELQAKSTEGSVKRQELSDVEAEGRRRAAELKQLRGRIAQVDPTETERCRRSLQEIHQDLSMLDELRDKGQAVEQAIRELSEEKSSLAAVNEKLAEDMGALKEEIDLLGRAGATCPLCGSDLTDEHRQEILGQKQADGKAKAAQYRENDAVIKENTQGITAWQADFVEIQQTTQKEKS
ncbi:MAG: hypothetical protein GTO63_05065, partial [Anaerolineae bacterium]|nr:hypothetical protein [Anaerolineae bacterium]NIN94366.1 hypothetical protein [Anaerolineae bacterium]NIQ77430.1 hypothetical protein [Anaerolineae bacterium]